MIKPSYVGSDENVQSIFGISPRYIMIQILLCTILLGTLILFNNGSSIVSAVLIIIWIISLIYWSSLIFIIEYVSTDKKIYKKTGLIWSKTIEIDRQNITDIGVEESLLEKILYKTGSLKINTAGSDKVEAILVRVANPRKRKDKIS